MNNTKMNNLRKMGGVTALLASTLAFANSVEAINLIGNYSSTNDLNGNLIISGIEQRAVGFTLPTGTSYVLDNITLRLFDYDTTVGGGGDIAQLQIYADANRTSTNPTQANLQVSFTGPTSVSNAPDNFSFAPISPFTFNANTRYWLVVRATAGDYYAWTGDSGKIAPAGVATFISPNGYQSSFNNGGIYDADNTTFNSFQINATAVPFEFEATGGLVMLGGAWLLHKHLQKKKT